jgi:methyl-accepting chemotaxis protein
LREFAGVKFRRSAPAILIGSSIFVVSALVGVSMLLTLEMLESSEEGSFKLMRDVLASILKTTEDRALNRSEMLGSMPAVRAAFIAHDRPKLLAECKDMFKEQHEKYGLAQTQFHTPPGVSFLRLHNPEKFGDDQTSYRPMLTEANREKALRKGVAITRAGPAVSGISPVADDNGQHVGTIEMGLDLSPMLDKMKQSYNLESAAFLDEKMLKEIATDIPGDVISPQNRVGKFIRFYATNPELARALVKDGDVEATEPKSYSRRFAGTPWGVQLVPMYNYANKQIGVYALAMDFSEMRASEGRVRAWQGLTALFAIVALAGVILVVIRGVLLAPLASLNERMAALADGDASKPADPMDSYCDELRTLASSYERLRAEDRES